jgi:anti-sigma factor RsiW
MNHLHGPPGLSCTEVDACLIDYVVAELAPAERAAVAAHLAGCPDCALASCRLRADLEGVAAVDPPPHLRARVRAAVAAAVRPPWWRRTLAAGARPIPAYAALAASLLPVVLWAAFQAWTTRAPRPSADPRPVVVADYDASAPIVRPWNLL